jgi:DNA-binding NtrC family response regulator
MAHLLIADDDPDIRELMTGIAIEEGFSVSQAADIKEARVQIALRSPDAILLDVRLPDGDGMQFWQGLDLPHTQVVFITGHADIDHVLDALRGGAIHYLMKPVRLQRLRAVLSELKSLAGPA